jgi:hypothetical protein
MNVKTIDQLVEFLKQIGITIVRSNHSSLAAGIRQNLYNTTCFIDTDVVITSRDNFCADAGSALYHGCYILNTNGFFRLDRIHI